MPPPPPPYPPADQERGACAKTPLKVQRGGTKTTNVNGPVRRVADQDTVKPIVPRSCPLTLLNRNITATVCRTVAKGKACANGDRCGYAHSAHEAQLWQRQCDEHQEKQRAKENREHKLDARRQLEKLGTAVPRKAAAPMASSEPRARPLLRQLPISMPRSNEGPRQRPPIGSVPPFH